jgi:outer membrane protein assembly factor BamB
VRLKRPPIAASFAFITLAAALAVASRGADNWPQWRGPLLTGAAPSGKPPVKWDEKTNIAWKVQIPGEGTSTPIIWGDQVFVQAAFPAQNPAAPPPRGEKGAKTIPTPTEPYQFVLMCLDRTSGKTLWQKVARVEVPHEGYRPADGSYAPASALTDGEHVYAFFGSRGLFCYDLKGNLKWDRDLGKQTTRFGFGEGSTPAVHGNTIVVMWDHEGDDFIVALDKRTGSELWRQPREEPTGWSTPLIVEHDGKAQVVTCGTNRVRSYDLVTGKQIWETEGLTPNSIPSAVTAAGVVYTTSGYQGSKLLAIRLGGMGDITGTSSILWRLDRDTPYVPSPLLSGNRLYFFKSNNAILTCLDSGTGKPLYSAQRVEGLQSVYASPVAAGGNVYLVGRNGTTVVIRDSDKLEVVATNVLNDPTDASPAVAGNQLFLRSRQNLYCIAEK